MAKKNDDDWKNLNKPVRKTDPYVSGGAYGNNGSYKNGGGSDGDSTGPFPEKKGPDCMTATIPIVVGIGLVGALARFAVRGRRG